MMISGTTRFYTVLADPVHHVRTPTLLNAYLSDRAIDVSVVPVHVTGPDLATVVNGLRRWKNLAGIGVTVPHKEAMIELVDELTSMAKMCGATNVVRREPNGHLVGGQFDGRGFVRSLAEAGYDVAGAKVLLAGAGGTGHALAFGLAEAGAALLHVHNRTRTRAEALAAAVQATYSECATAAKVDTDVAYDLVVNATVLGMGDEQDLPVPTDVLAPGAVVADVVMRSEPTPLLREAARRGCVPHIGERMLVAQFQETVEFLRLRSDS